MIDTRHASHVQGSAVSPRAADVDTAGVSHEALEYADQTVIIPQAPSFVDSFNVSVACALVLYEARGSRISALGRHGDLSPDQQRTLTAAMLLRHKVGQVPLSIMSRTLDRAVCQCGRMGVL